MFGPIIDELITSLRCLPGVGPKSAQRMVLHLLEREREGGKLLSEALSLALEEHVYFVVNTSVIRNICHVVKRYKASI